MNMRSSSRGFTVIELLFVVAIIGVLAALALPSLTAQASKAKGTEAVLQLEKIAKDATTYHATTGHFPVGTAAVLPAADGSACRTGSPTMPASAQWDADSMWSALGFSIADPTRFSYHYEATGPQSARAWATADLTCSGVLVTYQVVMEGRCDGSVAWVLIESDVARATDAAGCIGRLPERHERKQLVEHRRRRRVVWRRRFVGWRHVVRWRHVVGRRHVVWRRYVVGRRHVVGWRHVGWRHVGWRHVVGRRDVVGRRYVVGRRDVVGR